MARTAEVAVRLAEEIDTIPSICWRNDTDIYRWVEWLAPARPNAVGVDLSTLKHKHAWNWGMRGLQRLADLSDEAHLSPRLIAVGPIAAWKLKELRMTWPHSLTLASRGVWQLSKGHELLGEDGSRSQRLDLTFPELLAENISRLRMFLRSARPSSKTA